MSNRRTEGRFYIGMAVVALAVAVAGFGPAACAGAGRTAPVTLPLVAHGAIFGSWLLLFLTQTVLVSAGRIAVHRRLGYAAVGLATIMVVSGYMTAVAMARRGFDLSGDLIREGGDPLALLVFQLGDLLSFVVLVALAVWYRRRADVHKRLMLLATVGALMPAPLAHIFGHFQVLREIQAPLILVPVVMLLFAGAVHDRLTRRRAHPASLWAALAVFAWTNLRAVVIAPSDGWHTVAGWLIR